MSNLEKIIETEMEKLQSGEQIHVLFEDGIATIFHEGGRVMTLIEEVDYRVPGSVTQFKVG